MSPPTTTAPRPEIREIGDPPLPVLVWSLPVPMLAITSAPLGGGIGRRGWVLNAQVPSDYARTDIETHLGAIASAAGCRGPGVGFLTAASVAEYASGADGGVDVFATVGLQLPCWAAAPAGSEQQHAVGTVNVVAFVPARLTESALVNAVVTATEAKTQALLEHGVDGTGTASDAVCVLVPMDGPAEPFSGPRSPMGARLARAVHAAVGEGAASWSASEAAS